MWWSSTSVGRHHLSDKGCSEKRSCLSSPMLLGSLAAIRILKVSKLRQLNPFVLTICFHQLLSRNMWRDHD